MEPWLSGPVPMIVIAVVVMPVMVGVTARQHG
jgi:hypothetical protein